MDRESIEKMCEISVIIPVYNKSKYLKDTVDSVLDQTFGDYELLLIDDGSTDASGRICDELAVSDSRIKVFHMENRGVSAARNCGIRKAKGKYISFVDADDIIEKTFFERLYVSIEKSNSELAVCGYYEIKYGKRLDHIPEQSNKENEIYDALRFNLLCILWNKLYVRKKIKHLFDEKTATCEDSLFCAQYYYDNQPRVAYVTESLYGYIRHMDGLTVSLQKRPLYGIRRFTCCCICISDRISDKQMKQLAIHHICRVYFYAVSLFIFENACKGDMNKDSLSIIAQVIKNKEYRRIIKHILRYPFFEKEAEKTSKKEFLYILFSLLKMKRALFVLAKVKTALEPYKDQKQ